MPQPYNTISSVERDSGYFRRECDGGLHVRTYECKFTDDTILAHRHTQ